MFTIIIRTLIIYASLMIAMRILGKRQLGELELSELITTLLLSEIASLPITNTETPLSHALIPIVTVVGLELFLSGAIIKLPILRNLLVVHPAILIRQGVPDRRAMRRARISVEELISQLRLKNVTDTADIAYAILEPSGQISVIQTQKAIRDEGRSKKETGMMHLIISDGKINEKNLKVLKKDEAWVLHFLATQGTKVKNVFIFMMDDAGNTRLHLK